MAEHTDEQRRQWFLRDIQAAYEEHGLALGVEEGVLVVKSWDKEHDDVEAVPWGLPVRP